MKHNRKNVISKISATAISLCVTLAMICSFAFLGLWKPLTASAEPAVVDLKFLFDGTNTDTTKRTAINLYKDSYRYSDGNASLVAGALNSSEGHYRISGSYAFPNSANTAPIVARGGGSIYLELDNASIALNPTANSICSVINVIENTTLYLSWKGDNNVSKNNVSSANVYAIIGVDQGCTLILDGGTQTGDKLTVNGTNVNFCAGIGPSSYGTEGNLKEGGSVVVNTGTLDIPYANNAANIGGSQYSYLKEITVNGGTITGYNQGCGALIGGGRSNNNKTVAGKIIINGGTVSGQYGNSGTFIGGGLGSSPESIVINGGTFEAAPKNENSGMAAIGSGKGSTDVNSIKGGTLKITGGVFNISGITGQSNFGNVIGASMYSALDSVEITGGVIAVTSKIAGWSINNVGRGFSGTADKKVIIGPKASVKTVEDGTANVPLLKANGLQGPGGEDVLCTTVKMPAGYTPGTAVTVNQTAITFAAAHPDDSAYYLYLPAGNNELSVTISSVEYTASVASGGTLESGAWMWDAGESKTLTELNGTAKTSVILEKDGYTYNGASKIPSSGSYVYSNEYTLNTSGTPPITVKGGGNVYLQLSDSVLSRNTSETDANRTGSLIYIEGNTTLYLSFVGENYLSIELKNENNVYKNGDPLIRVGAGCEMIVLGGEEEGDLLTLDCEKANFASGIGIEQGTAGSILKGGKLTVKSGNIKLFGSDNSAAIGGTRYSYLEEIVIDGGNIEGEARVCGTLIGAPRDGGLNAGRVYINGGTIEATGAANGSAIGAGLGAALELLEITGGTINATLKTGSNNSCVIGVAGGAGNTNNALNGGALVISGGTVTADVGSSAVSNTAIGSGNFCAPKSITISGGTIVAKAGNSGAGIGVGGNSDGDCDIIISGGEITATGVGTASGIGYTANSTANINIKISGGIVKAVGGSGSGPAIGTAGNSADGKLNIEITGGVITAESSAGAIEMIGFGSTHHEDGEANLKITPGASVKTYRTGSTTNIPLTNALAELPQGADVFCTEIQGPAGFTAGTPISINGSAVTFEKFHPGDTTFYVYLPLKTDNALQVTVGGTTYYALVGTGQTISSGDWSTDPDNPGTPSEKTDEPDKDNPTVPTDGEKTSTTGIIKGRLVDENGRPIAGLVVSVYTDVEIFDTTDSNGNFTITNVPPGTYSLWVTDKEDYEYESDSVFTVKADSITTLVAVFDGESLTIQEENVPTGVVISSAVIIAVLCAAAIIIALKRRKEALV